MNRARPKREHEHFVVNNDPVLLGGGQNLLRGGDNDDRRLLRFGALFHRALLSAQTERAVDQADMTIGLWKIAKHTPGSRVELFREQAHVIAAQEQTGEELARLEMATLQYVIVNEPKAARQESTFATGSSR
jgi:hypothetical protein